MKYTTLYYLEKALEMAKKDLAKEKRLYEEAIGLHLTAETMSDPNFKKQWDKYFSTSSSVKMVKYSKHMDNSVKLECHVISDLSRILVSEKMRSS